MNITENKLQNEILYNIKYYQNYFITTFNKIINHKTNEIFSASIETDNSFTCIFTSNQNLLTKIIFSNKNLNEKWYLINNNNLVFENNNLIEVINYYLFINNRLALVPYDSNYDLEINELCNKIILTKI